MPITLAGRFSPFGPLGIRAEPHERSDETQQLGVLRAMPAAGEEIPDLDVAPTVQHREEGDDKYGIMMAVAGFGENDIEITANLLVVSGNLGKARDAGTTYLCRGIATRAFERRFSLANHVKVVGATLADGVLQVDLECELPEAMKPRRIAVGSKPGSGAKMIEGKKVVEARKAA